MNSPSKTTLSLAALALLGLAAATPARAQVGLFNFDSDSVGTTIGAATPFSDTSGGITATFSSPSDPGAFAVTAAADLSPGSVLLSGNVLASGLSSPPILNAPLDIAFDQNLSDLTLDFLDSDNGRGPLQTFTLQAFENGAPVGTVTVPGVIPANGFNPEGVIGFFGPSVFNSVELSTATTNAFAVDNIGVVAAPAPVPEASTTISFGLLLMLGMGGVMAAAKKRKQSA